MKKISMTEFQEISNKFQNITYTFSTSDQISDTNGDLVVFAEYTSAHIMLAPNTIFFEGAGGKLLLERVKSIEYFNYHGEYKFYVTCGSLYSDEDNRVYVIDTIKK